MTAPPFARMPWYPRDFRSSTLGWPLVARGAYRELIDAQWDIGGFGVGTLPEDGEALRTMVGASVGEWRIAWPYVQTKFPQVAGGGRRNERLEEHRRIAIEEYSNRRKGAAATNAKRWGQPGKGVVAQSLSELQATSRTTSRASRA